MSGPEVGGRCTHWIGAEHRYCREADGVRAFLPGPRCPAHTPNALRGLPETPPGPGRPRDWATPIPPHTPAARDKRPLAVAKTPKEA